MCDHFAVNTREYLNGAQRELSQSRTLEFGCFRLEVRRLLEENARLRSLLIAHSIPIPEAAQPTLHPPQTSNAAPEGRKPGIATAEQRIAWFHSPFRGREDAQILCVRSYRHRFR